MIQINEKLYNKMPDEIKLCFDELPNHERDEVVGLFPGEKEKSASRFFYAVKPSKRERNMGCEGLETSEKFTAGNYSQSPTCKDCGLTFNGTNNHSKCSGEVYYKEMESKNTKNNHPTVKAVALMEYLIKMITPKGGIVLDPFAGSGSTLIAAKQNGFDFIGMDLTPEYVEIAKARLKSVTKPII
jgi:site-specific DNA-methyltransferase (adenine-specific)